jgi:hypothetical protein
MINYFQTIVEKFARKVFPDGRYLTVGSPAEVHDQYDYIWVMSEDQIDNYLPHLAPGGIISGFGTTGRFGDDISRFEDCWFHVKADSGDFLYRPVVLTIDRTKQAIAELKKFGIEYDLFQGIKHKAGHIGCARSYYKIFEEHEDDDLLMILEDDVKFIRSPHTYDLSDAPSDFDAVYLGANIKGPCENNYGNYSRMLTAWTTHAIVWSKKLRDRVLKEFDPDKGMPIDEWLNRRMCELRCYVTNPFYAIQRPGISTITGGNSNYITIFNSQNRLQ